MLATIALLCSLSAPEPATPARTVVKSEAAKEALLGDHRLTLQWISWDRFGRVEVTERDGVLYLAGEQRDDKERGLLRVEGHVSQIEEKSFDFVGRIVTQVSHIAGGKPCVREGKMRFRISGKRKYWRLREMENPCDGVTDYVDIYFARP